MFRLYRSLFLYSRIQNSVAQRENQSYMSHKSCRHVREEGTPKNAPDFEQPGSNFAASGAAKTDAWEVFEQIVAAFAALPGSTCEYSKGCGRSHGARGACGGQVVRCLDICRVGRARVGRQGVDD